MIDRPASTTDRSASLELFNQFWDLYGEKSGFNGGTWGATAYRHQDGANFLHFDGHAAYKKKFEAYPLSNGKTGSPLQDRIDEMWNVYEAN